MENENVRENLCRFISARAGQKLPGEREMAAHFGVSRPLLRHLLTELAQEGLVERRQGSGTFAIHRNPSDPVLETVLLWIDSSLRLNDDPFFSLLIEQLLQTLQGEGVRSVVRRFTAGEKRLNQRPEDGIITLGLSAGESLRQSVSAGDPPVVALLVPDAPLPARAPFTLIQCDNIGAGRMAAERLIALGFDNIWFVGRSDIPASQERLTGAMQAGISVQTIEAPGLNFAGGQYVAARLPLSHDRKPLGIIAANDWLAVGFHVGLTTRGVPPELFQIISFDGLEIASQPAFRIESLAAPLTQIVEDAVAELRRLARTPPPPGRILRYSFDWRDSYPAQE